jgi:ribose 5-phosphate isomerase A
MDMDPKQRAAEAALQQFIRSDSTVGLGTGSTAEQFVIALAAALRTGRLSNIRGVPTSLATERQARELGIPLVNLSDVAPLDLTVDGADELAPNLDLIKGLGGALLREKIVAQNSRTLVIIADTSKRVQRLGERSPLPVEVVQFAHEAQARFLSTLGCSPELRTRQDGTSFVTDNSNFIYDCRFPAATGIPDPNALAAALANRAGVVESGLFLGMASAAVIATEDGVEIMQGK